MDYKRLQEIKRGYRGLQEITKVTRNYKNLQGGCNSLQRVTRL